MSTTRIELLLTTLQPSEGVDGESEYASDVEGEEDQLASDDEREVRETTAPLTLRD
jgi:hypothetical protein